jgi:hypothetical protein
MSYDEDQELIGDLAQENQDQAQKIGDQAETIAELCKALNRARHWLAKGAAEEIEKGTACPNDLAATIALADAALKRCA